jgi:hypothetical protein
MTKVLEPVTKESPYMRITVELRKLHPIPITSPNRKFALIVRKRIFLDSLSPPPAILSDNKGSIA